MRGRGELPQLIEDNIIKWQKVLATSAVKSIKNNYGVDKSGKTKRNPDVELMLPILLKELKKGSAKQQKTDTKAAKPPKPNAPDTATILTGIKKAEITAKRSVEPVNADDAYKILNEINKNRPAKPPQMTSQQAKPVDKNINNIFKIAINNAVQIYNNDKATNARTSNKIEIETTNKLNKLGNSLYKLDLLPNIRNEFYKNLVGQFTKFLRANPEVSRLTQEHMNKILKNSIAITEDTFKNIPVASKQVSQIKVMVYAAIGEELSELTATKADSASNNRKSFGRS